MNEAIDINLEHSGDRRDAALRSGRNMSDVERWFSIGAGAAMAIYGLTRRKGGWVLAGLGAWLVQRGASGHCHTYEMLGISTADAGSDTRRALGGRKGVRVEETVVINRPIEELYRF